MFYFFRIIKNIYSKYLYIQNIFWNSRFHFLKLTHFKTDRWLIDRVMNQIKRNWQHHLLHLAQGQEHTYAWENDCNWTRTHTHLVHKGTLNHLAKLTKWLSCVVSTYLYGAFDCMFLSCHVRVSEWIHTL